MRTVITTLENFRAEGRAEVSFDVSTRAVWSTCRDVPALLHELNVVVVVGFVRKFVVDSAPCWSPVWFRLSLWRVRGTASVL